MSHTCTDGASQLITGHFREYERFRRRRRKKENSKKNEEKRETFPPDIIILALARARFLCLFVYAVAASSFA